MKCHTVNTVYSISWFVCVQTLRMLFCLLCLVLAKIKKLTLLVSMTAPSDQRRKERVWTDKVSEGCCYSNNSSVSLRVLHND